MNIKFKIAFALLFLLALIGKQSDCVAQSVFDKDSIKVKGEVLYVIPFKFDYNISTDKTFLQPEHKSKTGLTDEGFIEGDFINRRELSLAYINMVSPKRARELATKPKMNLVLQFNNSGRVDAVKFIASRRTSLTPEDLISITNAIKSSVKIKLPESIKNARKLAPYNYSFDFLLMSFSGWANPETEPLHADWAKNDMDLLTQVAALDKSNPQNVVDFFAHITNYAERDTLGFGWTHVNTAKGAGYISVGLDYYIHNENIVSYTLSSKIAYRTDLASKYDSLLHISMPLDSGSTAYYKFKEERILTPLGEFTGRKKGVPLQMLRYMSPLSGTLYGYAGGLPVGTTKNRAMFNELIKKLSPDQIVTLMYSINPASRLSAIEYYYRHRELFKNRASIEGWIKKVYAQNATVESIGGCIVYRDKPENLVNNFLKFSEPLED